jgi:hypothetical protein
VYEVPVVPLVGPLGVLGVETISGTDVKLAITFFGLFIVIEVGLAVPERSPLQLLKEYPELDIAVRVTCSPSLYVDLLGFFDTDPKPVTLTVKVYRVGGFCVKLAVMFLFPFIVRAYGFVLPFISPLQPPKEYPGLGVAIKVTCSPSLYVALLGFFDTDPEPMRVTVKVY